MTGLRVVSFGYLHTAGGKAPHGMGAYDLRNALLDPHDDPAMRELTGLDDVIRDRVLGQPAAPYVINGLVQMAVCLHAGGQPLALGCSGGRHRSVVIAEAVAVELRHFGHDVAVEHLHVHLPVVTSPSI